MFENDKQFERMIENVRIDREPPAGHRQELKRRMLDAFAAGQARKGPSASRTDRRISLKGIFIMRNATIRIAAAVLIVGIVGGAIYFLAGSRTVAFADVVRAILDINNVTFKMNGTATIDGKESSIPTMDGAYRDPGLTRLSSDRMIMINDETQGKQLTLIPKLKQAIVTKILGNTGESRSDNMFADMRTRLEKMQAGQEKNVTPLGRKAIEGRKAVGFHVDDPGIAFTIWADPETRLPITIEYLIKMGKNQISSTMSDFVWGAQLDAQLFSLDVPKGYTVQQSEMDFSNLTEADLIEMFRIWTSYMDGVFPSSLEVNVVIELTGPLTKAASQSIPKPPPRKTPRSRPTTQQMTAMQDAMQDAIQDAIQKPMLKAARGLKFVKRLKPSNDSHYVGKGVKLNTPDTPVFWYKPDNSETYRVIYADLTVKDLSADQLPQDQR